MKEKLYQLAITAPLNKSFEVIEITEDNNDAYTIYIESLEGITINDCSLLTKHILNHLPEESNISLSVSSAGIDKPLRYPIQFLKNIGKKIEITSKNGKKQVGILKHYDEQKLIISKNEKKEVKELTFFHEEIQKVKVKIF